jgi:PAS domain S-box-containing protein
LTDDHQELRCLELYERTSGRHSKGGSLAADCYPRYFQALHTGSCIAADDAFLHPDTAEFAGDYLLQHNVTAMLDTPIHIRGELQGVLCLEQVGTRQPWAPAQRIFAQAVANLVTLALVEYEAEEARRQAQAANERLRAVFDASRDALILADGDSGEILDVNRQAEILIGRNRKELLGLPQGVLYSAEQRQRAAGEFSRLLEGASPWALVTELQRSEGGRARVEVTAEVADLSDGRRLALSIFRPF